MRKKASTLQALRVPLLDPVDVETRQSSRTVSTRSARKYVPRARKPAVTPIQVAQQERVEEAVSRVRRAMDRAMERWVQMRPSQSLRQLRAVERLFEGWVQRGKWQQEPTRKN